MMLPELHAAKDRLLALLTERAFAVKKVTLASGRESNFYVDCKQVTLHPEGALLTGLVLEGMVAELEAPIAAVGGLTLGADPIATAVSLVSQLRGRPRPAFIVRKEAKGHGTRRHLEGVEGLPAGCELVVLEDVVTTGASALEAVRRCREAGFVVRQVLGLVDREEGGKENIEAASLTLRSAFRRSDFPVAMPPA
ncbi:MAG: orotate phosphoribosyltransferase [Myxococcota bacterium]